jgi:hypothetical protein
LIVCLSFLVNSLQQDLSSEEPDLNLVTLIQAPEGDKAIDEGWIKDTVNRFETSDDVFQISFLSAVIFVTASNHSKFEITDGARKFLQSKGTHSVRHVPQLRGHESLLPGPYVIVQNRLRTVWRLYDDSYGTFVSTLRPQSGYVPLVPLLDRFQVNVSSSRF